MDRSGCPAVEQSDPAPEEQFPEDQRRRGVTCIHDFVELGKVVGVWGLKGWIKVHSHTRQWEDILTHKSWYLGSGRNKHLLSGGRRQGSGIVAHLEGIDDRDAAYCCIGQSISIPASELPPLAQDEFFWTQLEGLEAIDTSGNSLGVVDYLFETGANDVLVIKRDGREILVPCVSDVVCRVDLEKGVVELNWEIDN